MTTTLFLHGLDSSSQGTKGRYFNTHFPDVLSPDFNGDLEQRLIQLEKVCCDFEKVILIGSSFGGLMATCFAILHPSRVVKLILLAPALNFEDYHPPATMIASPTLLVMGAQDSVCPPEIVVPLADATFSNLKTQIFADDHLLRKVFPEMDWHKLLGGAGN
ncbi:MAG: alpha/beta hydrolase [Thermodesulfobacteriota bacterium]